MINIIPLFFNGNFYEFEAIFTIFCVISVGTLYFVLDNHYLKPHLNKVNNKYFNIQNIEIRVFFLFMSIIMLMSELIQLNFHKEGKFNYLSILIVLISLFVACSYSYLTKNKILIDIVLLSIFFMYQIDVLAKIYFNGNNLVYYGTIIIISYAASIVLKNYILYLVNVSLFFIYLYILLKLDKINSYDFYVFISSIIAVILFSYGKRLSILHSIKNLEFSKELINTSSTLLCAFDKYGNLLYTNKAITDILGYSSSEVKGKRFWRLTQDPDFIDIDYNELYQSGRTYVRRLTSKSGKLHYVLWSEKKINDNLFVSSGQDITVQYLQQQDYQTLFDNISEIVYELDRYGKITRINNFAEKICGYSKNELKGTFFKDLVYPEDISKIDTHYKDVSTVITSYKPLDFRVVKKDGSYIWVSQLVNTKLNGKGEIFGFTAIARVITEEKETQLKQNINILKSIKYQNLINEVYALNLSEINLLENIKYIIDKSNLLLDIDKVSIWRYSNNGIILEYNHFNDIKMIVGQFINKNDYPKYFESMIKYDSLVVSDVEINSNTSELYEHYFKPNGVKSLIDHVIKINGKIDRIICFEQFFRRTWTEDEIRFTKTIANYLALIIERNEKSKIEYILKKRGNLLNSINSIYSQLIKSTNFIEILNCDYDKIGEISNVSRLFFFENKRENNFFDLKYRWTNSTVQERTGMHTLNILNINNYPEILEQFEQKGYFSANKNDILSKSLSNLFTEIDIKTLLILPLYINNNLFGFIGLDDSEKDRTWQQEDIDIFISFSKNLESVIEKNIEK